MERAFTIGRQEVPVRNLSINLQSLLSGLHQARKQIKFSRTITALYTPLIWKYLNVSVDYILNVICNILNCFT